MRYPHFRQLDVPCLLVCLCAALAWAGNPPRAGAGLIENGGFENWRELTAPESKQDQVRSVQLVPPNSGPVAWLPFRESYKGQGPTATISKDETVKHGGARSVRIENRDMRDISLVRYTTEPFTARKDDPHNIRPNRRYQLRWWVKGEAIDANGTGPILMMYVTSLRDGKPYRSNSSEQRPLLQGTFDWQQRQHVFVTDANAQSMSITLQLRWTTGTAWFDDVELIDLGPVVQVETY